MPHKKYHKRHSRSDNSIDKFIIAVIDAIVTLWFFVFYGGFLLIKAIVTRRPIEKHSIAQQKSFKRTFVAIIVIVAAVIGLSYTVPGLWEVFVFFAVIILIPLLIVLVGKYQKQKIITNDMSRILYKALETMDTTARWYNNEEEANRELVTCLKAQGISNVIYQYRLGNGRTADVKVGDCLIECKLSPTTDEVDRLIGQISNYIQYTKKLNIVIYGKFDSLARKRIEDEIRSRYQNKAFLTYLSNPKRLRAFSPD
jgi:hypothetical protein